jgi:mitochondrial fission protein ELM1
MLLKLQELLFCWEVTINIIDIQIRFIKTFSEHLRYMVTASEKYKGGSLLITPSRRTRAEMIRELEKGLEGLPYQLWKGEGVNPYMEYLAISDAIVVTGDSISMMSESCLMGKPAYIAEVPIQNKKFKQFIGDLYSGRYAFSFGQNLYLGEFRPLNELDRVGKQVLELFRSHDS